MIGQLVLGCALACGAVVQAQDAAPAWKTDPYTDNDPESMAVAGYVAFGRLPWGDGHDTPDVDLVLGEVPVRWVETAHFRLGSSLPERKLDKQDKARVQEELARLRKRLPGVSARTRVLDPWLRVHLHAQRLEELYADFCGRMGVTDDDFPASPEQAAEAERFMGEGPYLGQRDKFLVLLLEKESSLGRYGQRYCGEKGRAPLRPNFHGRGSLCFATAGEFFEEDWDNEVAMHCHVVWNVVQNLTLGFKSYRHVTPKWWREGLAHWYLRRIEPRYGQFSAIVEPITEVAEEYEWPRKVRARVKFGVYPRAAELLAWPDAELRSFADHMMMWSRVDYLMNRDDDGLAVFMDVLNERIEVEPGQVPTFEQVLALQERALQAAWQLDAEGFDQAWSAWVLDTYPKR